MDITPKQLQQVLAIERFRHFGKAAEYLGMSQPALSRSLSALEQKLSVALFIRGRSGVRPTPAGERILVHARESRAAAATLARELAAIRGDEQPGIRIACGAYAAELSAVTALGRLERRASAPRISLEVTDWLDALRMLRSRACDLTLCELNPDFMARDLQTRRVGRHEVFALARPGHPLVGRSKLVDGDLLAFPWACARIPMRAVAHFGERRVAAGEIDLGAGMMVPRIATSSAIGTLALLPQTDAISLAPLELAAPMLDRGELALLDFRAPWLRLNYGFAWYADQPLSSTAEAFLAAVEEVEAELRDGHAELAERYLPERTVGQESAR